MQDRYTADIGDFAKYGLLRALSKGMQLGVAWYLYPNEGHNSDGKHIAYLEESEKWRHLDPELFDTLEEIVASNLRSTHSIERSNILEDASYSNTMLDFSGAPGERAKKRQQWFKEVESALGASDLTFTDPDNGLCEDDKYTPSNRVHWKRIPLSEVASIARGRTGIFYHHNSRFPGGHAMEIQYWLSKLGKNAVALYWRPYSPRTFFIVNPSERILEHIKSFADKWSPHFELHTFLDTPHIRRTDKTSSPRLQAVSYKTDKICPECGHRFTGNGWGGIDAHWKANHEHIMPYKEAWPLIRSGKWKKSLL